MIKYRRDDSDIRVWHGEDNNFECPLHHCRRRSLLWFIIEGEGEVMCIPSFISVHAAGSLLLPSGMWGGGLLTSSRCRWVVGVVVTILVCCRAGKIGRAFGDTSAAGCRWRESWKVRTLFITHKNFLDSPTVFDDVIHLRCIYIRNLSARNIILLWTEKNM